MRKRIVSLLMAVLMTVSLLPTAVWAEALEDEAQQEPAAETETVAEEPEAVAEAKAVAELEAVAATEANWVALDATNFPDENFRTYLQENFSATISDGKINVTAVTEIYCYNCEIKSLKGVEYFTALEDLRCSYNRLTELDVSNHTALTDLDCQYQFGDGLQSLNVSGCTKLDDLNFTNNKIDKLDISTNTALTELFCGGNLLTKLDISVNTELVTLYCGDNQLNKLDVTKHTNLEMLKCENNQLTTLDVSSNPELSYLHCYDNQLTGTLDLSNNPKLKDLDCSNNRLTALNVGSSTILGTLNCGQNQLTTLDVSGNTALTNLNCNDNKLTSLTVGTQTNLEYLECANNYLTEVDASGCSANVLRVLACSEMNVNELTVNVPGRDNLYLSTLGVDADKVTVQVKGEKQTGLPIAGRLLGGSYVTQKYMWLCDENGNKLCGTFANTFDAAGYRFDAAPVEDGTYTIGVYAYRTSSSPETKITVTVANGVVTGLPDAEESTDTETLSIEVYKMGTSESGTADGDSTDTLTDLRKAGFDVPEMETDFGVDVPCWSDYSDLCELDWYSSTGEMTLTLKEVSSEAWNAAYQQSVEWFSNTSAVLCVIPYYTPSGASVYSACMTSDESEALNFAKNYSAYSKNTGYCNWGTEIATVSNNCITNIDNETIYYMVVWYDANGEEIAKYATKINIQSESFLHYTKTVDEMLSSAGYSAPTEKYTAFEMPAGLVEGTDYTYSYSNGQMTVKLLPGDPAHWREAFETLLETQTFADACDWFGVTAGFTRPTTTMKYVCPYFTPQDDSGVDAYISGTYADSIGWSTAGAATASTHPFGAVTQSDDGTFTMTVPQGSAWVRNIVVWANSSQTATYKHTYTLNIEVDVGFTVSWKTVASGTCGDNLTWTLDSAGTLTISGSGAMTDYIYDGYTDASDCPWHEYRYNVRKIVIEDGVTSIGSSAFHFDYYATSVSIPGSVTSIGDSAFCGCNGLTSVTIPEGVTSIGGWAFYRCGNIKTISVPISLKEVGYAAFDTVDEWYQEGDDGEWYSGYSLTDIYYAGSSLQWVAIGGNEAGVPEDVTIHYAVENDSISGKCGDNLTWTLGGDGVLTISGTGVMTDYIYDGYTDASDCPWHDYRLAVKKIVIGDGVTHIGDNAFKFDVNATSVTIPGSVTSVGYYAFGGCYGLTKITIPGSVTSIDEGAFFHCTGLTEITISNGVSSIGYGAFCECSSLTTITIPGSVTSIGEDVFLRCDSLTTINFGGTEGQWVAIGGGNANVPEGATINFATLVASGKCGDNLTWTLDSNGTLTISGSGAMNDYYYDADESDCPWHEYRFTIKKVIIENGVTSIGNCAFMYDIGMESVSIPGSVTSIGEWAFRGCGSLTTITVPEGVTYIGEYAFYACDNMKTMYLPVSLTKVNNSAFYTADEWQDEDETWHYDCNLTDIYYAGSWTQWNSITNIGYADVPEDVAIHYAIENDSISGKCGDNLTWTLDDAGTLTISGTGKMADYYYDEDKTPWSDCPWHEYRSTIRNVIIKDGVTSIGSDAFTFNCYMESVSIPGSVTSIGYSAFFGCYGLTTVTIPEGVTSIGEYAFYACSRLVSISLPVSLQEVGDYALYAVNDWDKESQYYGSKLTDIYYAGSSLQWVAIGGNEAGVPEDVTIHYAVENGSISGTCGDNLTWTLDDAGTLTISGTGKMWDRWDENYENVLLPEWSSYTVKKLVIGNGVTYIGSRAFLGCTSLTEVIIPSAVTEVGYMAFAGCADLTTVAVSSSATSIKCSAFVACDSLTTINFGGTMAQWKAGNGRIVGLPLNTNVVCTDGTIAPVLSGSCGTSASYSISSSGVLTISGTGAMDDYTLDSNNAAGDCPWNGVRYAITKIVINDGITHIGNNAFAGDSFATDVTIPDSVISIGGNAFWDCNSLTEITIPDGVTSIGAGAFHYCISLTTITIPASVVEIGSGVLVFEECTSLTTVNFGGTEAQWAAIGGNEAGVPETATVIFAVSLEDELKKAGFTVPDTSQFFVNAPAGLIEGTDYTYRYDQTTGHVTIKLLKGNAAHWRKACQAVADDGLDSFGFTVGFEQPSGTNQLYLYFAQQDDAFVGSFINGSYTDYFTPYTGTTLHPGSTRTFADVGTSEDGAVTLSVEEGSRWVRCIAVWANNGVVKNQFMYTVSIEADEAFSHTWASLEDELGDLNGSGGVDITDVQCLYEYLISGECASNEDFSEVADLNGDKSVDVYDLQYLYEVVALGRTLQ